MERAKLSKKAVTEFLELYLGGSHLSGFKYLVHVISTQEYNNLYGNTSKDLNVNYKHIERSIRYYFSHVEKEMGKEKFRNILNLKPDMKLSNKNIIGQITTMLGK